MVVCAVVCWIWLDAWLLGRLWKGEKEQERRKRGGWMKIEVEKDGEMMILFVSLDYDIGMTNIGEMRWTIYGEK